MSSEKPVALENREESQDGRRFSPSAARNREVIGDVFQAHMPVCGTVLEVASGTGEHGAHIASGCAGLTWIYSDIDPPSLASQAAWRAHLGEDSGLAGPLALDVTRSDWQAAGVPDTLDAIYCANMIHIAPFAACEGLIAGAGRHLRAGGRLMLYGPFARDGEIAPSNADFTDSLRQRDSGWGVRDLDRQILLLAMAAGLRLAEAVAMPANNLSVIFEKAQAI
ncbi:MAG: class I SAM-dependent methyltransferase [Hyphomonadaceae bacterium]|nr:class I SAM-dependent methyltransferase [Hyphomonadaceae bacterium]